MTMNYISTLRCVVEGDGITKSFHLNTLSRPTPFPEPQSVIQLRATIYASHPNWFEGLQPTDLVLWRVSIPLDSTDLHEPITLNKDDSTVLHPMDELSKALPLPLPKDTIHIIIQRPQSANPDIYLGVQEQTCLLPITGAPQRLELEVPRPTRMMSHGITDIIEGIQGIFHPRGRVSDPVPKVSGMMPLLERPFDKPVKRVVANVINCIGSKKDRPVANALSSFLVCSGAAGIGKTRYGMELNNNLRQNLSKKVKEKGIDYSPYHYYAVLDFAKDAELHQFDAKLDAEIILGLRLAYFHFFQDKYIESFLDFHYRAKDNYGLFTLSNVIIAIRENLKLPAEKPIFLFLHIDEFQRIFNHRWKETPDRDRPSLPETEIHLAGDKTESCTEEGLGLFKDMMLTLGNYMTGTINPDIIQTFLSGTARLEVTLAARPTLCSFEFLSCPSLSLGACYDIMDHFMESDSVRPCQWIPKRGILYLLTATGGLPRALQLLLEKFFGPRLENYSKFLEKLSKIDEETENIFDDVGTRLDQLYSITDFAKTHRDLVCALVRLCLLQKPVERRLVPSDQFPLYTLDVLEREMHTILEDGDDNDGKVLVRIPFFFLFRYNRVVEQVQSLLKMIFLQDWESSRGSKFFEGIVADFEALRTNLLFADCETATIGEIYPGAMGRPETLNRIVKLKELSAVTLTHRFPESGRPTVAGEQELEWRSDKVFNNAAGASFADIFVCRESVCPESSSGNGDNGDNILFGIQAKMWTSAGMTLKTIKDEHEKNQKAIEKVPEGSLLAEDGVKNAQIITVLITTANVGDTNFKALNDSFPENCLLIYQGNFTKYFGQAFGVSAALALSEDVNWNFATEDTLKKKNLKDSEVKDILENVPYRSYDDLVRKVPALSKRNFTNEMGFSPYQNFQAEKRRRLI
ncbi:hypothetical protein EMPS_00400 [Entomortierella parvispora]|uniref:Crinkler effector protein N-terminal domain-containing protein n=1 Tax=Entomortierella parvispora TaxID=205924 RepID=A0A9P3H0S3_9FUNG|nr:hypothetical protein EMPS_00400 [Entomortierella parvispora]